MKKYWKFFITLLIIVILLGLGYIGYKEEVSLTSSPAGISSEAVQREGKLLARLSFDASDHGDCSVHDSWLEKMSVWTSRTWFGFNLGAKENPITLIYVVVNIPSDPLAASRLEFIEENPAAILTGSTSQTVYVDDKRYWFFASNTVFPPPDKLKFKCGEKEFIAKVVFP